VGGIVGAGLLQLFRVTFADDGRYIWVEPDPTMMGPTGAPLPPRQPAGPAMEPEPDPKAPAPKPAGSGAPAPQGPAPAPAPAAAPKPANKDVPKGLR